MSRPASEAKRQLVGLEREDCYVFHGTGLLLESLEPRQAYTVIDGKQEADGEPAVFASSLVDYAIFMALINDVNCPLSASSSVSYENGKLKFGASQETLDQLNATSRGYVYVFNRGDFLLRGGIEWMSHYHVKPVFVIEVGKTDFRRKINIRAPLL